MSKWNERYSDPKIQQIVKSLSSSENLLEKMLRKVQQQGGDLSATLLLSEISSSQLDEILALTGKTISALEKLDAEIEWEISSRMYLEDGGLHINEF